MDDRITVCGGGHQGLSMAAHLSLNGVDVSLWNRTKRNIRSIIDGGIINVSGVVSGMANISNASDKIEDVLTEFIMVTTPADAVKDIARVLAPHVHSDMVIVLNPGRTFGALEFQRALKDNGVIDLPHIAETQSIIYTCRRDDSNKVEIFALKNDIKIASIDVNDIDYILDRMPECLKKHFVPVDSVMETSLSNIGMVLHCAPVLMNIGWIESTVVDFKYYYDGISKSIADFLEKIDYERIETAKAYGYKVESVSEWLVRIYGAKGNSLYECIRSTKAYEKIDAPNTIQHRYILEDIPCGLVPIESVAKKCGVRTPYISAVIDFASLVYEKNFRDVGRQIEQYIE